jgi:spermidine/putrescine transport system permease protein
VAKRSKALLAYAVGYIAFLYLPVLLIPVFSVNDSTVVAFPLQGFTWRWYQQLLSDTQLAAAFRNSMTVAVAVSAISTAIGTLAAKGVAQRKLPGGRMLVGLLTLPLVVPSMILGIALLMLARYVFQIPLSLWTVGAGHLLLCIPFAMLVMISRLESFDKALEEASLDLGRTHWSTFWLVTFPLVLPGVVASFLLCVTVSLDEFVLAYFLAGNEATLPIYIFSQLRFPTRLPIVLALGACILLATFPIVLLSNWIRRWGVQTSFRSGEGA